MDNLKGNLTTIITWISFIILPYVATYGITQEQLTALLTSIIGIAFAIYNSKHPNDFEFLGNGEEENTQTETVELPSEDEIADGGC